LPGSRIALSQQKNAKNMVYLLKPWWFWHISNSRLFTHYTTANHSRINITLGMKPISQVLRIVDKTLYILNPRYINAN